MNATPPRRSASQPVAAMAAPWKSAPPTRVAHVAPPASFDSGASSQNIIGPGWLNPRLYTPTSGVCAVNTSRTNRSMLATSSIGKYGRPTRVTSTATTGVSASTNTTATNAGDDRSR